MFCRVDVAGNAPMEPAGGIMCEAVALWNVVGVLWLIPSESDSNVAWVRMADVTEVVSSGVVSRDALIKSELEGEEQGYLCSCFFMCRSRLVCCPKALSHT